MAESKSQHRLPAWLLAVLSGLLLGLSQPIVIEAFGDEPIDPTGLSGVFAVVGFVPVLLAMRGVGLRRAYWLGFIASFVQFTLNVQWLVVAMVVFGRIPLFVSWAILALLTAAMAAYVATAYAVTRLLVGTSGRRVPMWVVFPLCLCAAETLRNFGPLGGFPWGNVGTSFATVPVLLQPASLFGVYGLVLCAALSSSTVAELVAWWRASAVRKPPFPLRAVIVGAVLMVGWIGFGVVRLAIDDPSGAPVVKVGLLQGNIEQGIRNQREWTGRSVLQRYQSLQDEALALGAQLIVWPEASFPVRLRRDLPDLRSEGLVGDGGRVPQAAVVGASTYEPAVVEGKRIKIRSNSAFVLGEGLKVKGRVDKTHLVPFGEYVPWPLDALLQQLVPIGGTVPGARFEAIAVTLGDRVVKLGTTICYEGIFPEISRQLRKAGAELHVNVTNDGWYGISSAASQHLNFYAIRAVESGIPVVRAANTGRSGWADNRGRLHDVTPIYVDRAVVAEVPLSIATTPYVLLGEWLALPCAVFAMLAWLLAMVGVDVHRRKRAALDSALGVFGALLAAVGVVMFFAGKDVEEARATRYLLVVLAGLLIGAGALSGRPWGRKAQMVVGLLALVFCLAAAAFGAPIYLLVAALGLALFLVQRRRAGAYQRAADPLVLDDT